MSSTNKTVTIELSQYVGTDKPTYLSDYNGDMLKIDTAIAADRDSIATAQNTADNASLKADANTESISTLNETVNGAGTGLGPRLTNLESTVNTINELIGNGEPTTTDKTLIGAINELDADITNYTASSFHDINISADGVKTVATLLNELYASIIDYVEDNPNKKIILLNIRSIALHMNFPLNIGSNHISGGFAIGGTIYDSGVKIHAGFVEPANSTLYVLAAGTDTNLSSDVPTSGTIQARLIVIS